MFKKLKDLIKKIRVKKEKNKSKKTIIKKIKTSLDVLRNENKEIKLYSGFLDDLGTNHEQKRAVVSKSNRLLVLAGAGSGKTKVLTKRIIHLVKNKKTPINGILALTFTRAAKDEMIKRLAVALDMKTEALKKNVRTLHSFALSILRQNEQFDVIDQEQQEELIENILIDFKDDDKIMQSMHNYIMQNILVRLKETDNVSNWVKNKPTDFGEKRFKTKSGVFVRSKSERDLADYLTSVGIEWEYEKEVVWADSPFKPDFTLKDCEVYIEHWCYNNETPEFKLINKKKYLDHRTWKENQYKKHHKILISIDEDEMFDWQKLQDKLKKELEKETKRRIIKKQLFDIYELTEENKKAYEKFVYELIEIINLIKSRMLTISEVEKNVSTELKSKVIDFYGVLVPVFKKYEEYLKKTDYGKKDFNDLIGDSIELLKNNESRRKHYQDKLSHILVDEYQDVSYGDVELLKLIVTDKTSLFAVGDDWQSIYGWRGADVNYILNFEKDFGEYEKIILPINYRSKKNIVAASSQFIQAKFNQTKKNIVCTEENNKDVSKIIQVNARNDFCAARYIIQKVRKLLSEHSKLTKEDFLILYRSRRNMFGYNKEFKTQEFKIPLHTIHWSKGTEARYVFVVGLKGGIYGFPNVYADKAIKKPILDIPVEDKEAEERRLFYVAMTRAKEKLFLIAEHKNESEYVIEIPFDYKLIDEEKDARAR